MKFTLLPNASLSDTQLSCIQDIFVGLCLAFRVTWLEIIKSLYRLEFLGEISLLLGNCNGPGRPVQLYAESTMVQDTTLTRVTIDVHI